MEVIAEISRDRGRFHVRLGNGDVFHIPAALMRERMLVEGQELDPEEYDQWLMVRQYRQALDRAVGFLASRARSCGEVEKKLLQAGYRPCTVEMVICKLQKEKLLNDAEFAQQWVEARSGKKLGKRRIEMELRRKGVSADDTEEAMEAIDDDEQISGAIALAQKAAARANPDEDPRKTAQRISGMLARRGYGWDIVRQAVNEAMADLQDE